MLLLEADRELVRPEDLDDLPAEALEEEIVGLARQVSRLNARWLAFIAAFDRRECWRMHGRLNTAEWLAWRCGIDIRTARDHVLLARRLTELPQIAQAYARGDISYSKARTVARVADESNESEMLELAQTTPIGELERTVRSMRAAPSADVAVVNSAHENRYFTHWWEEDGTLSFRGQLSPEDGALLVETLGQICDAMRGRPAEENGERKFLPRGTQMADAMVELLRDGAPRAQVVVHVDDSALACTAERAEDRQGETCAIENGPAVPSETVRRLSCDGEVMIAIRRADGSVDLGRKQRVVSPQLRNAVLRRDGGRCRFPGCERRDRLAIHHVEHWAHGGETNAANLVPLCPYHHRCEHEGGFSIRMQDGELHFIGPEGVLVEEVPEPPGRPPGPGHAGRGEVVLRDDGERLLFDFV